MSSASVRRLTDRIRSLRFERAILIGSCLWSGCCIVGISFLHEKERKAFKEQDNLLDISLQRNADFINSMSQHSIELANRLKQMHSNFNILEKMHQNEKRDKLARLEIMQMALERLGEQERLKFGRNLKELNTQYAQRTRELLIERDSSQLEGSTIDHSDRES